MSRFLPPQPDLEHLKNEAKSLLRDHRAGNAAACGAFRRLQRFTHATDQQILSATVTLTEAQFALAMDYGFKSWDELRKTVENWRPLANSGTPPKPGALRLSDPPAARPGAHRLTSAYHLGLRYCGVDCDYDTVTGDSGMAFILQADSLHKAGGADREELDIGYWPVDQWGSLLRLGFMERVFGRKLSALSWLEHADQYGQDPEAHYRKYFEPEVVKSLSAGHPVMALEHSMWLVTGIDEGNPGLLGQLSCSQVPEVKRLGRYPWSIIVIGDETAVMDRTQADTEAIGFALQLHKDQHGSDLPGKSSGKASFALWSREIRSQDRYGPHFYHANVVGQMRQLRASAPPYLRQMATRHGSTVANRLLAAAEIYESVLAKLGTADTSKEAFANVSGREALAHLVDEVAIMEGQAVGELNYAIRNE